MQRRAPVKSPGPGHQPPEDGADAISATPKWSIGVNPATDFWRQPPCYFQARGLQSAQAISATFVCGLLLQTTLVFALLVGRPAFADPVAVGDVLHFIGSDSHIWGGAFDVDNTSNGLGVDFQSFCLQINQDLDFDNLFVVGFDYRFRQTTTADRIRSPLETAWIFTSFRHGALSAFTSDEIQAAIWALEGEWTLAAARSGFVAPPSSAIRNR